MKTITPTGLENTFSYNSRGSKEVILKDIEIIPDEGSNGVAIPVDIFQNNDIIFQKCKFSIYSITFIRKGDKKNISVIFKDCDIDDSHLKFEKIDSLSLEINNTRINDLIVSGCKDPFVKFKNVVGVGFFTLMQNKGLRVYLDEKNQLSKFDIVGNEIEHLKFRNSDISYLTIDRNQCPSGIDLHQQTVNKLVLSNNRFDLTCDLSFMNIDLLYVHGNHFEYGWDFLIQDAVNTSKVKSIYLEGNVFKKEVNIGNYQDYSGLIGQIDKVEISLNKDSEGVFNIEKVYIVELKITGKSENAIINLDKIRLWRIDLKHFINEKTLKISNCNFSDKKNHTHFNIENSYLKDLEIINVDLSKASVIINESFISEIITSNVKWPKKILSESNSQSRENYRQLKHAMNSQNNKIQALAFESLELESYRKELKEFGWFNNITDKIILLTGWTNNHGQSWWRALWIYLIMAFLIIQLPFIGFLYNWDVSPTLEWFSAQWGIDTYIELLNPTHKLTDITAKLKGENYQPGTALIILDFAAKLLAAFFYFQIIRAFRKYVR